MSEEVVQDQSLRDTKGQEPFYDGAVAAYERRRSDRVYCGCVVAVGFALMAIHLSCALLLLLCENQAWDFAVQNAQK